MNSRRSDPHPDLPTRLATGVRPISAGDLERLERPIGEMEVPETSWRVIGAAARDWRTLAAIGLIFALAVFS